MYKNIIFIVIAFMFITLSAQVSFLEFTFEGDTIEASLGTGTFENVGGSTRTFAAGYLGGRAANVAGYTADMPNETAGIVISVPTVGYSNIALSWNQRNSNTGANRIRVKYTLDGVTWLNFDATDENATNTNVHLNPNVDRGFDNGLYITNTNVGSSAAEGWYSRTANFISIEGANENPNFAVRLVIAYPTGEDGYAGSGGGNFGTTGTTRFDNIFFTHIDSDGVLPPVASPRGGAFAEPFDVTLTSQTPGASIYYTTDGNYPEEGVGTLYAEPIHISSSTVLRAIAVKEGMNPSNVITEEYFLPMNITSIAELRRQTPGTTQLYNIPFELLVSQVQDFRNQKYVQDSTGAILIDDRGPDSNFGSPGVIKSVYEIGDGMTGLSGRINTFDGMLQFLPTTDPGAPSSKGNAIEPRSITLLDFLNNFDRYEAMLVRLHTVHFLTPTGNFAANQSYPLSDGENIVNMRVTFSTADYVGTAIPSGNLDIIGILEERNAGRFILPRSLGDFLEPTLDENDFTIIPNHRLIGNFPNPFNPSTTIAFELMTSSHVNISIFNVRGQRIATVLDEERGLGSHTIHWNGKDDKGLDMSSGIYFYRMETNENVQVKRAILLK